MKRWKSSVAMSGLATGLPLSTSHKFRVGTLSFLFGAICLCLSLGSGLSRQKTRHLHPAATINQD